MKLTFIKRLIFSNSFIRCSHSYGCNNSNETVHIKFERFSTESEYDFLIIGDPDAFETADLASVDYLYDYFYYNINEYLQTGKALILDGDQTIGIWASSASIENFDIYFHRMVLLANSKIFPVESHYFDPDNLSLQTVIQVSLFTQNIRFQTHLKRWFS